MMRRTRNSEQNMPKCERCGAFMEQMATACTWCGAGGDNGSAASFVVPPVPITPEPALAGADAESNSAAFSVGVNAQSAAQKNLKGIGGWLVLVAINLVLAALGLLFGLGTDLLVLMGGRIPASASRPAVTGLLFFDAFSDLILLAALIALNIFFYGKKKIFPRWFITFLAVNFVLTFALQQMLSSYLPAYPSLMAFGSFVSASGWIAYVLRSERVRQTFVN